MNTIVACARLLRRSATGSALRAMFAVALSGVIAAAPATEAIELQLIEQDVEQAEALMVAPPLLPLNGSDTLAFTQVEMAGPADVVPGRPYSAQLTIVKHQPLVDGNTITQEQHGRVFRDAEGRIRREDETGLPGTGRHQVLITDPIEDTTVLLLPARRLAMRLVPPPGPETALALARDAGNIVDTAASTPVAIAATRAAVTDDFVISLPLPGEPVTVTLGERRVEGLRAIGTRTTLDIPAAAIGNRERIAIVTEQWYSPELEVVLSSEHRDPRVGTTSYRLHAIESGDPDPSLFQIPPDYALTDHLP